MQQPHREGLRLRLHRIARQVDDQHRHLRRFQEALAAACRPTLDPSAASACEQFARALRDHFELEEGMFFPALHGYEPGRESALTTLRAQHAVFERRVRELAELIAAGSDEVAQALERLLKDMAEHEREEHGLWQEVD